MAEYPSLPLYTDAYLADTRHLTLEEHGLYMLMLMMAWRDRSCSLPSDDNQISRVLGISPRTWRRLKPVMMTFWDEGEHGFIQKRLAKELRKRRETSEKNSNSAKARWLKTNETADANAYAGHNHNHNHIKKEPPCSPPTKRRTQLNVETLPDDWREYALAKRPDLDPNRVWEDFRDYWLGKGGLMVDWKRTWQRWVRNEKPRTSSTGRASKTERAKAAIGSWYDASVAGGPRRQESFGGDVVPLLPGTSSVWTGAREPEEPG